MVETMTDRLTEAWARTDRIFQILAPGAWLAQPIALRHPFIFYLGHLPAFAWNHVGHELLGRPTFNGSFDELFSRGIDPDVDDPTRCHDHPDTPAVWPAVPEVVAYRDRVRAALVNAGAAVADRAATHVMAREGRVFAMVAEHELMHQETLLYMMQRLPMEQKVRPGWVPPLVTTPGRPAGKVDVPAGRAVLGARFEELPFGWDNEFSAVEVAVPAYRIDGTPVTNAQFLAFVEDGGYRRPELWTDEDRVWLGHAAIEHPVVWELEDGRWVYRTLFERVPLESVGDWPVFVSLAEARAFARWRGERLPTEAEWHRAAYGDASHRFPWGDAPITERHGNVGFRHWAPTPVGTHPDGASGWGVQDLIGDGWEWTNTVFAGLPGFSAYIPGYPGYSADFFDGKHYVQKGGSWATADDLIRPSFRNWFQAHYPYVFAKFRCVVDG
ncbi:MAG TPA: SUMF1/EgtB/PvdO family nonheme iron enzyme [Methylomirabilota bacterium]|nr:SUMF1/EgtB/PvdO family nonheme iron enzyme [Methylomirabilota bacterium]